MPIWISGLASFLIALTRRRAELVAGNTALRQQLSLMGRRRSRPVPLTRIDRILFALLYRLFPGVLSSIQIVRPETVIRWHRMGIRILWRWKSRPRGGRPTISKEIRDLIREISLANPLWRAPRIRGELQMMDVKVAQSTVAKYMAKRRGPPSQSWKTFLRNHTDGVASADFFIVPTIGFKLLFAFTVLEHRRRRLIHLAVTTHPTAEWTAQQILEAFPWDHAPTEIIRDNDRVYGHLYRKRPRSLGIRDRPTAFRSPWQNGYAERLISSIRRDCLNHVIVRDADHLRRVLRAYARYYNAVRTHLCLRKDSPLHRPQLTDGRLITRPHLGGLHHEYARI